MDDRASTSSNQATGPDLSTFTDYLSAASVSKLKHQFARAAEPDKFLYTVVTHHSLGGKEDIALHSGPSKASPILGIVKLHSLHSTTLGLGDPNTPLSETQVSTRMVYESLVRLSKWSVKTHKFEYEDLVGDRKTYIWSTTKTWLGTMREMELRVVVGSTGRSNSVGTKTGKDGKGKEGEELQKGELMAVWRRSDKWNMKRGNLFLGKEAEMDERWRTMVLLSLLAIVERLQRM